MKGILEASLSLISMVGTVLKFIPIQKCYHYKRIIRIAILYSISFIFLVTFYVFGCIALYSFLMPYWGAVFTALFICLLSLLIATVLVLSSKLLKPKKKKPASSHPLFPSLEKNLEQMLHTEDLKNVIQKVPATALISVAVVGTLAVASYIIFSKKKD